MKIEVKNNTTPNNAKIVIRKQILLRATKLLRDIKAEANIENR